MVPASSSGQRETPQFLAELGVVTGRKSLFSPFEEASMPIVQSYPLGVSMHTPTLAARPVTPAKRGEVKGWSAQAARRHVTFLQSVDADALQGFGYAVTLTVASMPASAVEWGRLRSAWIDRCQRNNLTHYHWVTEWQRRGAPHLHAAVFFDHELTAGERLKLLKDWLEIASEYGALIWGQRVERLRSAASWGRYCAKHSARSSSHAQRQAMPPGWTTSGRLWGKGGDWPTRVERWAVDVDAFHQLRRLVRSWRVADARRDPVVKNRPRRIVQARRCLSRGERSSAIWGMREWAPETVTRQMIVWLIRNGYGVVPILDPVVEVDAAPVLRLVSIA